MRYVSAENQLALEQRRLIARDFVWLIAKRRDTGASVTEGWWSDVYNVNAAVINQDTGIAQTRSFFGAGSLIEISDIPLVNNMSVQNVTIRASQLHQEVERVVREYDCQQARVEIYRGFFSPETRLMVAPAAARFIGFVDSIEIQTPSENEDGEVTFMCVSHTQEITRANSETRSSAYQKIRSANDGFYDDADTVPDWEYFWGNERGSSGTAPKKKKWYDIF